MKPHWMRLARLAVLSLAPWACAKRRPPSPDVTVAIAEPAPPPSFSGETDEDDSAASAPWTVEVADGATLRVNYRGSQVMSFHYLFWGQNFSWANPVVKNTRTADGVTSFEVDVETLGLSIGGKIRKAGPGEIAIDYAIAASKQLDDVVGGGIEFNLSLDAAVPGKENLPVLFAEQRGFQWEAAATDAITVAFEPHLPSMFFEKDQRSTIRCFLVGRQIRPGTSKVAMRLRLPRGGAVRRSVDERYGREDRSAWYQRTLEWDKWPVEGYQIGRASCRERVLDHV